MELIDKFQLMELRDGNQDFVLVDVRPKNNFQKGRIPCSINIPTKNKEIKNKLEEKIPKKNKKIGVYGTGGKYKPSVRFAKKLDKLGYTEVYVYKEGLKDWKESGYPVFSN